MLFLQPWFWVYAAAAIPGYWICRPRLRPCWLILASAVFFVHFASPAGVAPVVVLAAVTYGCGFALAGPRGQWVLVAACTLLVGALAFYKYSSFAAANLAALLGGLHLAVPAWLTAWRSPAAPLGISFFTFEFVHYLYEVRVRRREPVRNLVHFAVFAGFFPTLAAGPIKRFPDFVPQLIAVRTPEWAEVIEGVKRVIRGLFKKVCIADVLVECIKVFEEPRQFTGPIVCSLAVLQGFRIYYDFAGYSDMAIGLGQLMGLRVPENFDRPYFSTELRDFWRRWHMSLSSWIRDYIYIPLGGNRAHRAFNLLAAMILCGLWHGASWNFAVWGMYHGTGLALEAGVRRWQPGLFTNNWPQRLLGWAICYTFVTYGWLLFFYPLATVWRMTVALF